MSFNFERCHIPDVVLITPRVFGDERGYFMETYKKSDWEAFGLPTGFTQDNESFSKAGVLRGLHYQLAPFAQGKLVRVVTGSIFDVAVDIREGSATFGQWVGRILSAKNKNMLWVPPGFAHGVLVLEDNTHLLYKCTGEYKPSHERSILWSDSTLNIQWPKVEVSNYLLSEKDAAASSFNSIFHSASGKKS